MTLMLTEEERTLLAQEFVKQEVKVHKLESEKVLRNSRKMLEHYRELKDYVSVPMPKLTDDVLIPSLELDRELRELAVYRDKTEKYIEFVDGVLARYKQRCMAGTPEQERRYKVIDSRFLSPTPQTINKLAKRFNCDTKTIQRDITKAAEELKPMLFGVFGLIEMSK